MEALIQASKDKLNCYAVGQEYLTRIESLLDKEKKVFNLNYRRECDEYRLELAGILADCISKVDSNEKNFDLSPIQPEGRKLLITSLAFDTLVAVKASIEKRNDTERLESNLSESLANLTELDLPVLNV